MNAVVVFNFLFKSMDFFVEEAVGLAYWFFCQGVIISIVLVGFCTTYRVCSIIQSAFLGHSEIALGNA
jgi:Ca2+/Na+ antiporter